MLPGTPIHIKTRKRKLKNKKLSKELAKLGWKQMEDSVWERKVGKTHFARIWKPCSGIYLSIRSKEYDRIPLASIKLPTVMEAVEAFPYELLSSLRGAMQRHEIMIELCEAAAITLKRSTARMKKKNIKAEEYNGI